MPANETEALRVSEPLHCSLFHIVSLLDREYCSEWYGCCSSIQDETLWLAIRLGFLVDHDKRRGLPRSSHAVQPDDLLLAGKDLFCGFLLGTAQLVSGG